MLPNRLLSTPCSGRGLLRRGTTRWRSKRPAARTRLRRLPVSWWTRSTFARDACSGLRHRHQIPVNQLENALQRAWRNGERSRTADHAVVDHRAWRVRAADAGGVRITERIVIIGELQIGTHTRIQRWSTVR